ncbi:TetR family transcriptional regulator, partial [Streptomyces griseomycini]
MSQPAKSVRTPATTEPPESAAGSRAAAQRLKMRRELAAAAMELFATKGYEATTVDEIAAAAGVARRTFFRHFRSKEEAIFPDHDDT